MKTESVLKFKYKIYRKHRLKKMNGTTKTLSKCKKTYSHQSRNKRLDIRRLAMYGVQQICKWSTTDKFNKDNKPIIFITTILVNTCYGTHLYNKSKETSFVDSHTLTTQYTIYIQKHKFCDGLTKGHRCSET